MMFRMRRRTRSTPLLLVLLAMAAVACDRTRNEPEDPDEPGRADLPRDPICDDSTFHTFALDQQRRALARTTAAQTTDTAGALLVAARTLDATQFHDCQQLIHADADGNLAYGTLAALLVDTFAIAEAAGFDTGKLVADIIAYDSNFDPIGITHLRNCVWLRGNASDSIWEAAVWSRAQDADCPATPPTSTRWRVRRLMFTGGGPNPIYPSAGRWMWDTVNHVQGVGIRCGLGWCEFGAAGYVGTPAIANSAAVPGWKDEQLMAFPTAGGLRVSNVLGTITPGPGNSALVANLSFSNGDSAVLAKYRLMYGIPGQGRTGRIFARPVPTDPTKWEAAAAANPVKWTLVKRYPHMHGPSTPGRSVVRWAWNPDDEKAWFPCDNGCCMTDGRIEP